MVYGIEGCSIYRGSDSRRANMSAGCMQHMHVTRAVSIHSAHCPLTGTAGSHRDGRVQAKYMQESGGLGLR